MNNSIVIDLLRKIIKVKKMPFEQKAIAKYKLDCLIEHHYKLNYINKEDYKNLKYFFKKLLTK